MKLLGIQFRLLLLGIAPTILLVSSLAFYFIQYHYLDLENALKEKGQVTINQLAISSIYGVFSANTDVLSEISNGLLDEPDIVSVQIIDSLGEVLVKSEKTPLPPENELLFFQHPVTIHTINKKPNVPITTSTLSAISIPVKTLGTVKITLSLENTHKQQQTYLFNSLLLICIGIICTILFALRLSRTISSPIVNLTRTANDLANGSMNARASESSIFEINTLCQSFNMMAIGLQQTQHYLTHQVDLAVNKLSETLESLEEKNKSLEINTQLAISQNKTKSQFIAHISHEIRTPMNGILGFIELLTNSNLSLQQREQTQLIETSATSLLAIVNEILDYSSLETGNFKINVSTFNLRENIENCITTIFPASNKVQIILDVDNTIPDFISTDPIRLQQIITNLLGNACKFTLQGHILIRCRLLETHSLFITISDTGTGIHKDKIHRLFQPFLQTSEYAVTNDLGTGLGLTICKNIIERLGGTVGVCTEYNTGSTFWLNLPISVTTPIQPETQKQTILVIDSFSLRRNALTKQLTYLGYKTNSFASISDIEQQKKNVYNIIFYAEEKKNYEAEQVRNKIKSVSSGAIIFLNPYKKPLPSIHFLTLPCRSSYLKNTIESVTKIKSISAHSTKNKTSQKTSLFSIFIADDNEINRLLLKSQLETHCKNITLANDGQAALSCLQKNKYDLIFLDLQMPYYSGQELIKLIKQPKSINKESPVIAITAHAQSHQRKVLIEAGFDECLIKPVLMEQLIEILDLWLPVATTHFKSGNDPIDYVMIMLDKTSGNIELAINLFNKLFSELQEQSLAIEKALEANDLTLAEEITHKLHGSVSFCGYTDIQNLVRTLEIYLSKKNPQLATPSFVLLKNKIIDFVELKEGILNQLSKM